MTARRLSAPLVLTCDGAPVPLQDAVVDVDDAGRITHVGPRAEAPATDAPVTHCSGLLMPGLVNTHAHTPLALLRGMGGDLPLMRWLTEVVWPAEARLDAADVRTGMLAGGTEMLRAGVTTSTEMYFWADTVVEAVLELGSRVVMTPGIITAPGMDRLGTWEEMRDGISRWIDADGLRFGPGERVELGYGAHSAYTLSAEAVATTAAAARERGALLHIHVAEAAGEDDEVRAVYGSVPAMLETTGSLGGRVLAAHSIQMSDQDVEIFARHDVAVAHCPGSNAKLAAGVARVGEMLTAGLRVGLGTDSPASNDDLDLWEEQRLASLFARQRGGDATALTAADVLALATAGGADALGRDDLGRLRPGAWGDVVHVDLDDPAFVDPDDPAQLVSNLVWSAGSRAVRDVWVAGEPVVADRIPVRVDPAEILAATRAAGRRIKG
ncbi:amidohydrolase [Actinomycetospora corticicola]|uniref:5-methylthioadenosine/S-adenosylhomocysteine deaminase n=1 Tax=Actinomycetospora corticicola TaxID=663602 RepID=A0A7Y9DZ56_9PSEU|nr:amidohydrolase family protein [Actinomycetospora corticicola]NYD38144.1 5-methylthioadenosine/S-adenosylhomocysteine deaminase [Actinomycetospora corticicola]